MKFVKKQNKLTAEIDKIIGGLEGEK